MTAPVAFVVFAPVKSTSSKSKRVRAATDSRRRSKYAARASETECGRNSNDPPPLSLISANIPVTSTCEPQLAIISEDHSVMLSVVSLRQVIWPGLENEHGWTKTYGTRNNDSYYFPRGVERGKKGVRCRLDFFDSFKQVKVEAKSIVNQTPHISLRDPVTGLRFIVIAYLVSGQTLATAAQATAFQISPLHGTKILISQVIEHMIGKKSTYDGLLERAWAQSVKKPRVFSKKSGNTGRTRRKKSWTDINRVSVCKRTPAFWLAAGRLRHPSVVSAFRQRWETPHRPDFRLVLKMRVRYHIRSQG